jgi:hypothetical protein
MASQSASAVNITGGTIKNATISGLAADIAVTDGGTGVSALTPNAVLIGNTTSTGAVSSVRPSTNGNILTSTAGTTVNASALVEGIEYTILTLGTSVNWVAMGASAATVGVSFLKNATAFSGTGGTATTNVWTSAAPATSITSGTAVASTSGTSIDFTGIPSWVKRVTVMFQGVSTSGTSPVQVRIGTGGTPTTTGYVSYGGVAGGTTKFNVTTGFYFNDATSAANWLRNGTMTFTNISGNIWVESLQGGFFNGTDGYGLSGGGNISLSGVLDMIRITTVNGTDTFDAGSINIMYE